MAQFICQSCSLAGDTATAAYDSEGLLVDTAHDGCFDLPEDSLETRTPNPSLIAENTSLSFDPAAPWSQEADGWAPDTHYSAGALVLWGNTVRRAVISHISSATFLEDRDNWVVAAPPWSRGIVGRVPT